MIEEYQVQGLGHGTPLSTRHPHSGEAVGPHMLEAGISSTRSIVRFWGLATCEARGSTPWAPPPGVGDRPPAQAQDSITNTIENSLRAAGLLR